MKKEFDVDGVHYVAVFKDDHELVFYADALKSEKAVYQQNALERGFGDESPLMVFCDTRTGHPFKVKQEVITFVEQVIRRYTPYYFTYNTFESDRVSLYSRVAKRLGAKFGYDVTYEEGTFRFARHNR